jgi:hypothetical protein
MNSQKDWTDSCYDSSEYEEEIEDQNHEFDEESKTIEPERIGSYTLEEIIANSKDKTQIVPP